MAKETLYSRSQIQNPGAKYLNFPNDLDTNWYEGFCSEVQVTKHTNGRPYLVWEVLPRVRNEVLDTAVYALAAAELCGISRVSWSSLEEKLKAQNKENLSFKEISVSDTNDKPKTIVRSSSEQNNKNERGSPRRRQAQGQVSLVRSRTRKRRK